MLTRRIATILIPLLTTALAADLPVREVILYKSGVGYFARSGPLAAGDSARLDFKATDMNDVLKSLTVADDSGTPIRGLRYDSATPLAQKLAEFPFTVADGQQLSAFVDHLRGARIELKLAAETLAGVIVSARTVPSNDKQPEREQLILLLDSIRDLMAEVRSKVSEENSLFERVMPTHLQILECIAARDVRGAKRAMREHLKVALSIQSELLLRAPR